MTSASTYTSTRIKFFPFRCACAYGCVSAATSENEILLRHNISTRRFTTLGYVWPMKILDPDYLAPTHFDRFVLFCLCLCLRRISFSLGSFLLLAFVLASLVKTRLKIHSAFKRFRVRAQLTATFL